MGNTEERQKYVDKYEKMSLVELLDDRFNGSFQRDTIQEVIMKKARAYEDKEKG